MLKNPRNKKSKNTTEWKWEWKLLPLSTLEHIVVIEDLAAKDTKSDS